MKNKFIQCGFIGWTIELFATSLGNYHKNGDKRLMGNTSLLMFPIYGMAAAMAPVGKLLCKRNMLVRGTVYMTMIFAAEYSTGWFLRRLGVCPWDYSDAPLNVDGLIRLDYAPAWFAAGLIFEQNTCKEIRKEYKEACRSKKKF
ncbi:putative ABC transporter permease [Cuneatibacter caecimuris]|uniref:Putative ABC transporter type IV n=1 Tax=Cuneatibacter caecimuris TaxID=1796618 RepID=A0A4Q7NXS6_9FIRM|nr:hypothetical protein [Cuneatibacter caecimuris]RZS92037.1 putative ABC transporter type IV [Cuneatibacter caecimuris]